MKKRFWEWVTVGVVAVVVLVLVGIILGGDAYYVYEVCRRCGWKKRTVRPITRAELEDVKGRRLEPPAIYEDEDPRSPEMSAVERVTWGTRRERDEVRGRWFELCPVCEKKGVRSELLRVDPKTFKNWADIRFLKDHRKLVEKADALGISMRDAWRIFHGRE